MVVMEPFEIRSVVTGTIRLDGGAMFGVVPKVLWEKVTDVDDQNRVLLATRTLLAIDRSTRRVILVDTGCGTKWAPDVAERYAINLRPNALDDALADAGYSRADVTDIVITHLHFDHNGGLADWFDDPGGRTQLRYPQARHWVHRIHWEHANRPHRKDRASFLEQDFAALANAEVLNFVEGKQPRPSMEGIEWVLSHGHTPYQLLPLFGTGPDRLLFVGDACPTVAHLKLGWVMAYDLQPQTTIDEKQALFQRCLDDSISIAFPHDPEVGGVSIGGTVTRPIVSHAIEL